MTVQLYEQGENYPNDNAALAWTLSALLDATIMVHGHLWDVLHQMALEHVLQDRDGAKDLTCILGFSQCMHSSLACSLQTSKGVKTAPDVHR